MGPLHPKRRHLDHPVIPRPPHFSTDIIVSHVGMGQNWAVPKYEYNQNDHKTSPFFMPHLPMDSAPPPARPCIDAAQLTFRHCQGQATIPALGATSYHGSRLEDFSQMAQKGGSPTQTNGPRSKMAVRSVQNTSFKSLVSLVKYVSPGNSKMNE